MPDFTKESLLVRYESILNQIIKRLPLARIYVMAYYPVNGKHNFGNEYVKEALKVRTNTLIDEVNEEVKKMADKLQVRYIDVNRNLYDENNDLKKEYSVEGMHMYANGYRAILEDLLAYVME